MLGERVAIKEFFVKDFCNRDEATAHVTIGTQSKRGLVDKLKRKFIEEAKMLYRMQHPGIVRVFDIFEENSTAYFVMDYIDGPSLSEIVTKEGALSEARAVRYIRQVAEALKYVHDQDRLHLDIKPGNIMVDSNDNAILIDFGASKQYDEVDGENTSTLLGKTPGYAPLEQIGNDVVKFLPATDIYALGATLYKLVTGITPLSANLLASGEELAPLPNSISAATRKAIDETMRINKNKRTQSVVEFLALLGGEKTDSKLSQSSNVQTQPTSEEATKLTNEEETLVIGDTRENTQLDKEKKETPREPSATLVESKTWKELFKERHPIVNVMMVVMSIVMLYGLLLASFLDYGTYGGLLYISVSLLIVVLGLTKLFKHKQSGFMFTALSVPIMSVISLIYFVTSYEYFSFSYLENFTYFLLNLAIDPIIVLLVYYGILHIKSKGKSAWESMKPAPLWMKRCAWCVWILLFVCIFAAKGLANNMAQKEKERIEQQQRAKEKANQDAKAREARVKDAEEKIRQQQEEEKRREIAKYANFTIPALDWSKVTLDDKLLLDDDITKCTHLLQALPDDAAYLEERPEILRLLKSTRLDIIPSDIFNYKRVRSIQVNKLGIFSYNYFNCRFKTKNNLLFFEKTSGSQRKSGYVYKNDPKSCIFLGGWTVNDDPQTIYGSENSIAGSLYRVGTNKLLMVFFDGNGFELYEIVK